MKNKRKGFTIVELVIVIAVIAILAAVLIPTFTNIIQKAKVSNDTQLIKNLNTALAADAKEHKTMTDALDAAKEFGFDVEKIVAKASNNKILWDSKNDVFCYLVADSKTEDHVEYVPNSKTIEQNTTETYDPNKVNTVDYWEIATKLPLQARFSIYAAKNWEGSFDVADLKEGFDVGEIGDKFTSISYDRTPSDRGTATNGQTVTIRTNSATTALTINAASDTVYHYDTVGNVEILAVADHSYHESGAATNLAVKSGHVVVSENAKVNTLLVDATQTGAVSIENNGDVTLLDTISSANEVAITNNGTITTAAVTSEQSSAIQGTKPTATVTEIIKLTADTHEITKGGYYDGTGITINSTRNDSVSNGAAIQIRTSEKVIINGVTITGYGGINFSNTESNSAAGTYDLTLMNCTFNSTKLAVQVWYNNETDDSVGSKITVKNCSFMNSAVTDYDIQAISKTWGLFLNNTKGYEIDVENTKFYGYGYAILTNSSGMQHNMTINMNNCDVKGRAALDLLNMCDSTVNVTNTKILGLNTFGGSSEDFGNIVIENQSENNTINLTDNKFEVYRSPATEYNGQKAIEIRGANNNINLNGTNTMVGNIYYEAESTLPQSSAELCYLISLGPDCKVTGSFTSSIAICRQGSNEITLDWSNCSPSLPIENYFFIPDFSYVPSYAFSELCPILYGGDKITLFGNTITISESVSIGTSGTITINFNGYKINQENDATLIIPVGVTINTDSTTSVASLFSAPEGYEVVETQLDNGTYSYTVAAVA